MSPRHFSKMYQNKSQHRHDQTSDWDSFQKDMKVLTGVLYSIPKKILKPFFPIKAKQKAEDKKKEPKHSSCCICNQCMNK